MGIKMLVMDQWYINILLFVLPVAIASDHLGVCYRACFKNVFGEVISLLFLSNTLH